jgi:hypothetical protein
MDVLGKGSCTSKGMSRCHSLKIRSDRTSGNAKKGKRLSRILWEGVEHQLERARADLLVIFDCCYAGLLANDDPRAPPPKRIFEYLGATLHNKIARGPSEFSFTMALVYALRELATEPEGFTTSQLLARIKKAPNFKDIDQEPVWSPRGKNPSLFRLKISPLEQADDDQITHQTSHDMASVDDGFQVYLQLQLAFDKTPTKQTIRSLSESFKNIVHNDDVPLRQVRWKGLSKEDIKMDFKGAAIIKLIEVVSRHRRLGSLSLSPAADANEVPKLSVPVVERVQITTMASAEADQYGQVSIRPNAAADSVNLLITQVLALGLTRQATYALAVCGGLGVAFGAFAAKTRLFSKMLLHEY